MAKKPAPKQNIFQKALAAVKQVFQPAASVRPTAQPLPKAAFKAPVNLKPLNSFASATSPAKISTPASFAAPRSPVQLAAPKPSSIQQLATSSPQFKQQVTASLNRPQFKPPTGLGSAIRPDSPAISDLKNVGSGNFRQTLGGLVGLTGKVAGGVLAPFAGTVEASGRPNPLEFNLSERISGQPKKPGFASYISGESSMGQSQASNPRAAANDKARADQVARDRARKQLELESNLQTTESALGPAMDFADQGYNAMNQDLYAELDANSQRSYDEVMRAYESGAISEEDALNRLRENEKKQKLLQYDKLKAYQEGLIPQYEQEFETGRNKLQRQTDEAKAEGARQEAETGQTYGELLRGITERKNAGRQQLGNIFSSLGTAESSAAIEKFAGLESEAGDLSAKTDQERVQQLQTIKRNVANIEQKTREEVGTMEQRKNQLIQQVRQNINISEEQKLNDIDGINARFDQAIQQTIQGLNDAKANAALLERQYAEDRFTRNQQFGQDQQLAQMQLGAATQGLGDFGSLVPPEIDSIARSIVKSKPGSNYQTVLQQLMQQLGIQGLAR